MAENEPLPAKPEETPDRDVYYDAALADTILFCDRCQASLDPDCDLGEGIGFHTDGYYILLGDEAFRRGWYVARVKPGEYFPLTILCPTCTPKD